MRDFFRYDASCELLDGPEERVRRVLIGGRRGTGKTTGVKAAIASDGWSALWVCQSLTSMPAAISEFTPPAVRDVLPELVETEDVGVFRFGEGLIRFVSLTAVKALRATGASCGARLVDHLIVDEIVHPDGVYWRQEARAVDDIAATCGRGGILPLVICMYNPPKDNLNPYSQTWKVDLRAVGDYEDEDGGISRVISTASCRSCFEKKIGEDPHVRKYTQTLHSGGFCVMVDGVGLRLRRLSGGWWYVGQAEDGELWLADGLWTAASRSKRAIGLRGDVVDAWLRNQIVYDSYRAELAFGQLIRRY